MQSVAQSDAVGGDAVDAFILFNEREELIPAIVEAVSTQGITTYLWRRDIAIGEQWEETEARRLAAAKAVVVFLGAQGWGPTHRRLMEEAQKLQKRIIPVLIGEPPAGAIDEAGGAFKRLRYVDLRQSDETGLSQLFDAIRARATGPRFASLIGQIIDGNEVERAQALQQVIDGSVVDRVGLSARLREQIETRFGPQQEKEFAQAIRDPKKMPSVRAWMMSALIWTDAELEPNRQLILRHLDVRHEPDRNVRFWALAGLHQRGASYRDVAVRASLEDRAPEVAMLARAIANPEDGALLKSFQERLQSRDFDQAWPVLRLLRVLPLQPLAGDVSQLLAGTAADDRLAYDSLFALANPVMARAAAPIVLERYGLDDVVERVVGVSSSADPAALRQFARLLAEFDSAGVEAALATAEARRPSDAAVIARLRRYVRATHEKAPAPESFVAGYASDVIDVSRDDLDIREDVQTLVAVMLAKEVKPPLAIGLFGDWGSGKSFFMQSMKQAVNALSARSRESSSARFCNEVVSIEFNAWHYADTNLWASLVSHILESLARHVSPQDSPEAQQARLVQQLGSAREVLAQIKGERDATEAQIKEREQELKKVQLERGRKEIALRDLRMTDLRALLEDDKELQKELQTALEEMGAPAALSSVADLSRAVAEMNSLGGRATAFAVGLYKGPNRWLTLFLLVLVLAVPVAGYLLHQHVRDSLVIIGTLVTEIVLVLGSLTGWLIGAAGHVKTALGKVEAAKHRVDVALAARRSAPGESEITLQQQIATLKVEEELATSRLRAATDKVIELEQKITSINESRSLARFLGERTRSDDYRKHLGLISTIRRDFETITSRLADSESAVGQGKVERIILYIDDLDRCPADKVVDVLQAVHLLLAYPLFVVVVGVDPRWLAHSLSTSFGALADDPDDKAAGEWRSTPQNYLEKIFQIPFSLRPMSQAGYARLVQGLFATPLRPLSQPAAAQMPDRERATDAWAPEARPSQETGFLQTRSGEPEASDQAMRPAAPPAFAIHDEALVIKAVEAAFAEQLYALLPTPRATKRFANIYRILKASIVLDQIDAFEGREGAPGTFQVPMLLLAVLIGAPEEAAELFPELLREARQGLGMQESLRRPPVTSTHGQALTAVRERMSVIAAAEAFPQSADVILHWVPRVARFSFEVGRTLRPILTSTR